MTYVITATLKAKDGKLEELTKILKDHAAWVKDNEPDTIAYNVHKVKGKDVLFVYEVYKDEAAFNLHTGNLIKGPGASLTPCVDGNVAIVMLEDA